MQLTPNYKLKKPEGTDPVDIQDFNDNADLIDAALKKKAESSGGDISGMTVKTLDDITTEFPVPVAGESTKTFLGKVKKFFSDTKNWMTGVCLIGQIVNNCVTNNAKLPLSAAQGKVLMDLYNVLNTNLTTLYTTRWANNVDKITVGPGTVVTTEIAVPTISGYTPIGAIGFSTKQGLSVYQCSVDGQGKVARVYVYNGTSTTVINEIGQAGVHILYLRNFTK